MGETAIDEDTFNDYIQEMNDVYTADKVQLFAEPLITNADFFL